MGQSSDQLRQEIEQHREDAAQKIDQLQSQVQGTTEDLRHQAEDTVDQVREQVMGTVEDTVQSVKESVNIQEQIEQRPLVALGAALVGGFVLGGMLGGGGGKQRRSPSDYAGGTSSQGGGMSDTVRDAFKRSGLEETLSNAAAAMMGSATEQVKHTLDRNLPGFSEKMEAAKHQEGSVMDKARQTQP